MSVSVIIPTLNEAAAVEAAILSARDSGADEVIVVDGGSTDETVRISKAAHAQVIRSALGRGTQQNVGADAATGAVLLFLHADSQLTSQCLTQIAALARGDRYGAFRQRIDASGWKYRLLEKGNAYRVQRWGIPYGDQAIFIRRELFERVGKFPAVPIMEDYLLAHRTKRHQRPKLLAGPVITSARRWQRRGVVRQTLQNWSLVAATRIGATPHRLARHYPSVR